MPVSAVSCCVAGTTVLFANRIIPGGKWSLLKVINGCLIGMICSNVLCAYTIEMT